MRRRYVLCRRSCALQVSGRYPEAQAHRVPDPHSIFGVVRYFHAASQYRPRNRAAGLGGSARPYGTAAAVLAGRQAEIGGDSRGWLKRGNSPTSARIVAATTGPTPFDACSACTCFAQGELPAARGLGLNRRLAGFAVRTRVQIILERDLLRWMSEATGLQRGNIDPDEGVLTVRQSKFGKSRVVPLHRTTSEALLS